MQIVGMCWGGASLAAEGDVEEAAAREPVAAAQAPAAGGDPPEAADPTAPDRLAQAEPASEDRNRPEEMVAPRVDVIGTQQQLDAITGTATVIDQQELETSRVFTTNEALRKAPGVNVRDEEGMGLRPNIGIRGLNPSRSTKTLLLEDGIPLSYAPYGDNASYYHPPVDRFERIEVYKGSEQIRFGPQTAGGVVNYITPLPTTAPSGFVSLAGGNNDYRDAHARLSRGPVLLDYIYKQSDGSRDNTFLQINDFNVKAVLDLSATQALTLRANYYTEDSQVTYSGLTDAEYANFGETYNPFDNDTFDAYRIGASATHQVQFSPDVLLLTNFYGAYFSRDWWRQSSTTTDTQCGAAFALARRLGLAVDPDSCNSTQGRLRDYVTIGIEPRLFVNFETGGYLNQLEVAIKYQYEDQERKQKNGSSPTARDGTLVEDNQRIVNAYSAFIQDRFNIGRFSITPGVRVENIHYKRTNRLAAGGAGLTGTETLTEVLPAIGGTFSPDPTTTFYADYHKGFSPPRVEDIINNTTLQSVQVEPDDADEFEIGVRTAPRPGVSFEAAAFSNYFSQQTVVGSVAGGNLPLASGSALYQGIELAGRLDFGPLLRLSHNPYARIAYQWLPVADIESTFRAVDTGLPIQGNLVGNRLPYAPENLLNIGLGYTDPSGFSGEVEYVYTGAQYADFANTVTAPANGNGQVGMLDSYSVVNIALNYSVPKTGFTGFFTIKNLFDAEYIADRTRGILPGTPRLYQAGVQYAF
jgi:Fe(3+) dicitrate transport protein